IASVRLPALSRSYSGPTFTPSPGSFGGDTRSTSAPSERSSCPAKGTGPIACSSTTFRPARGSEAVIGRDPCGGCVGWVASVGSPQALRVAQDHRMPGGAPAFGGAGRRRSAGLGIDVERTPVRDRLGRVLRADRLGTAEVGDGAGELVHAVQRARRPVPAACDLPQQGRGGIVERAVPVDLGRRKVSVRLGLP